MGELEELEECTSKKNPHVLVDWIGPNKGTSFNSVSDSQAVIHATQAPRGTPALVSTMI